MTWLRNILGQKPPSSALAKSRLKMVLTHDRGELPAALLEEIRDDIIQAITRRLALDRESVVVKLTHTPTESRLVAEIPLQQMVGARRRR
jgi:cell division topological specificity factor